GSVAVLGGELDTTPRRINAETLSLSFRLASKVPTKVEPDSPLAGSSNRPSAESRRTTLTASAGRKPKGMEYGGGLGASVAGATSTGAESSVGGTSGAPSVVESWARAVVVENRDRLAKSRGSVLGRGWE